MRLLKYIAAFAWALLLFVGIVLFCNLLYAALVPAKAPVLAHVAVVMLGLAIAILCSLSSYRATLDSIRIQRARRETRRQAQRRLASLISQQP